MTFCKSSRQVCPIKEAADQSVLLQEQQTSLSYCRSSRLVCPIAGAADQSVLLQEQQTSLSCCRSSRPVCPNEGAADQSVLLQEQLASLYYCRSSRLVCPIAGAPGQFFPAIIDAVFTCPLTAPCILPHPHFVVSAVNLFAPVTVNFLSQNVSLHSSHIPGPIFCL